MPFRKPEYFLEKTLVDKHTLQNPGRIALAADERIGLAGIIANSE